MDLKLTDRAAHVIRRRGGTAVVGILGRGLSATVDGLNGAACPIELL